MTSTFKWTSNYESRRYSYQNRPDQLSNYSKIGKVLFAMIIRIFGFEFRDEASMFSVLTTLSAPSNPFSAYQTHSF